MDNKIDMEGELFSYRRKIRELYQNILDNPDKTPEIPKCQKDAIIIGFLLLGQLEKTNLSVFMKYATRLEKEYAYILCSEAYRKLKDEVANNEEWLIFHSKNKSSFWGIDN